MSKASNRSFFFYLGYKLITVAKGNQYRTIFRNADQPLAELNTDETRTGCLLATDDKGSVLAVQSQDEHQ